MQGEPGIVRWVCAECLNDENRFDHSLKIELFGTSAVSAEMLTTFDPLSRLLASLRVQLADLVRGAGLIRAIRIGTTYFRARQHSPEEPLMTANNWGRLVIKMPATRIV